MPVDPRKEDVSIAIEDMTLIAYSGTKPADIIYENVRLLYLILDLIS